MAQERDVLARDRLRKALKGTTLTPFVGAGLSAAVTGGKPCATWRGLLLEGLEVCQREDSSLRDDWAAGKKNDLDRGDMASYLSVAEEISYRLRNLHEGREFDSWIESTVGQLEPTGAGRHLIESVCALGTVIITTNYDNLIEQVQPAWRSYAWNDEDFANASTESQVVLHLHGSARKPQSIILCNGDYQLLNANKLNQILSDYLFVSRRFIFIGCGEGLADPHIAPLLKMTIALIPKNQEHFILVTEEQRHQLQGGKLSERISPVPYGKRYEDLPKFLQDLAEDDQVKGSQGPPRDFPNAAAKPSSPWLARAGHAQEQLRGIMERFDHVEDAVRQVVRHGALPLGIELWDYPYQQDKHEKLATLLNDSAKKLEDLSAQIVPAFEDTVEEVWQLTVPTSAMRTARLVPITERVSELVDVSRRLLTKLAPTLDELQSRIVDCSDYQAPCDSLSHALTSIEKAHRIAVSLQEGLSRQQTRHETSGTRPRQSVVQTPGRAPSRPDPPLTEPSGPASVPADRTGSAESEVWLVPMLGEVAAGMPILANEESGEYLPLPARFVRREDAFVAKVRGESMVGDGVFDRDYIVLVRDPDPKDGEMVVALTEDIEGADEVGVRVKRLWYEGDTVIRLESSPPDESPIRLGRDVLRATYKVIGVIRWGVK